jgi:hypothetical protein
MSQTSLNTFGVPKIIELLPEYLPVSKTLSETPTSTIDGIKVMKGSRQMDRVVTEEL